jgi:hypothetical protein
MKLAVVVLGMMVVMAGNAHAFGSSRSSSGGNVSTTSSEPLMTAPNEDLGTGGLSVTIQSAKNFNESDMAHLLESRQVLERIVNSEEFKQRVLHFTYGGQETFVQNQGLTNLQIYNLILMGAERLPSLTEPNHVMDLSVQLYTSSYFGRNVVGYTTPSTSTIYMNTYFYRSATPGDTAANMIHEWMHKIGFDHDYNATARRPYSVPYAIGSLVEELSR